MKDSSTGEHSTISTMPDKASFLKRKQYLLWLLSVEGGSSVYSYVMKNILRFIFTKYAGTNVF